MRDDVVDQMLGRLRHAPGTALPGEGARKVSAALSRRLADATGARSNYRLRASWRPEGSRSETGDVSFVAGNSMN